MRKNFEEGRSGRRCGNYLRQGYNLISDGLFEVPLEKQYKPVAGKAITFIFWKQRLQRVGEIGVLEISDDAQHYCRWP